MDIINYNRSPKYNDIMNNENQVQKDKYLELFKKQYDSNSPAIRASSLILIDKIGVFDDLFDIFTDCMRNESNDYVRVMMAKTIIYLKDDPRFHIIFLVSMKDECPGVRYEIFKTTIHLIEHANIFRLVLKFLNDNDLSISTNSYKLLYHLENHDKFDDLLLELIMENKNEYFHPELKSIIISLNKYDSLMTCFDYLNIHLKHEIIELINESDRIDLIEEITNKISNGI